MADAAPLLIPALGVVAALLARRSFAAKARFSPVAARLSTLTTGIALLLVMRLFAAVSSAAIADIGVMLVATWLPLLTLWLVEELRRRHAPRPLKFFALFGALGFSVVALVLGPWWSAAAMFALAAYQAAMLAVLVILLARRDDLSSAEWASAQMLLAALLYALPLTLTDFTAIFPDLPVRGGVFALLLLLLAAARLAHERARPLWLLYDVLALLAVGALTY
ncbi:MAG: hypothetical protein MUF41_03570, partial [Sphingopyxis sp.]|nr:hypothetical protein [Sphingopyxis sp.]